MSNNKRHQALVQFFNTLLDAFLAIKSLGVVLLAGFPMFISDNQPAREPDLMVVLTDHEDRVKQTHVEGVADIVIEVVSPESVARDRGEKFSEYEAARVPEYWLIDPQRMEIRVYALNADGVYHPVELDEQGRIRSRVLPTFALDPAILWNEQLPRAPQVIALVEQMG